MARMKRAYDVGSNVQTSLKRKDQFGCTGLQKNLSATIRSQQLFDLSEKRGARLRAVRNLSGRTIEEFAEEVGLSSGTLGRLERAETCLTLTNADMISYGMSCIGLNVTSEWLLSGRGTGPQWVIKEKFSIKDYLLSKAGVNVEEHNEKNQIVDRSMSVFLHVNLFQEIFPDRTIIMFAKDNKMRPFVEKGEIVAGLVVDNLEEAAGQVCIIELEDKKIVRRLDLIGKNIVLSTLEIEEGPMILEEKPKKVARILLKYKSSPPSPDLTRVHVNYSKDKNLDFFQELFLEQPGKDD